MARAHSPATPHLAGLTFYSLLLCLFSLAHTVLGQVPSPVQEMAFARAGPLLYVQGGKFENNGVVQTVTNQLYALDLSRSWATTAAPWINLAAGDSNFLFNAVAASNNQSIYTIATAANNAFSFKKYNIPTNTWDPNPFLSGTSNQIRLATRPVIDPRTGLVYLTDTNYMNIFNVVSGAMDSNLMPSYALTSRRFMGSVYNAARQSIMFYGGLDFNGTIDPLATYVTEYNIELKAWSNFTTTGTPPVSRSDFCMASSEDGNKVVVYGGRIPLNNSATPPIAYTDTFHILDIPTGQWTQGPSGSPRLYMACVIVGDQFVAWGGARGDGNTYSSTPPVVFDLTKGQWVDKYTAPSYLLNGPHPTTNGPASPTGTPQPSPGAPESKSSNSNLGAILGGVFGSLFVITMAGVIYMFLLRRQDKIKYSTPSDQKPGRDARNDDDDNINNNNSSSSKNGPEALQSPPTSFLSSLFTYQQQNDSQHSQPRNPQQILPKSSELESRAPQVPQDLSSLQMKHTPKVDGPVYALVNNTPQPPKAPQHIHVHNPVVTSVPSVNYGYVASAANNTPLVYHPQSEYPMPRQPGVTMATSQPANVVYVAHPTPPLDYSNTNTIVFDTTLASEGSNPSTQYGYTSDPYATRSTQLSPTNTQTQVYYAPSTTAATGHPSGVPVFVAYSQGPTGQGYEATSPVASTKPTGAHYYSAHVPGFGPSYTSDVNVHVPSTQP